MKNINTFDEFVNEGFKDKFLGFIDKIVKKFGKSFTTKVEYKDYLRDLKEKESEKVNDLMVKVSDSLDKEWVIKNKNKENYNLLVANKIKDSLSDNDYHLYVKTLQKHF
jgi:hypothetical protein